MASLEERVMELVDRAECDEDKAKIAAAILNETNPNKDTLAAFFTALSDSTHGELINRAMDQEERP